MTKLKDITSVRFGRLVVTKRVQNRNGHPYWLCHCDCGNDTEVSGINLKNGHVRSCGCFKKEFHTKHGRHGTKEWRIYHKIKSRCFNKNNAEYHNYGGRGITMCDEWNNDFLNFYRDMGECPLGMSIDRWPNNNGNYEPGNCRWATQKQQCRNMRKNTILTHNGETKTLPEWAESLGMLYDTLRGRLRMGWEVERMLTTPVKK